MPVRQVELNRSPGVEPQVPDIDGREGPRRSSLSAEFPGDDADPAGAAGQIDRRDVGRKDRLVPGRRPLVLVGYGAGAGKLTQSWTMRNGPPVLVNSGE